MATTDEILGAARDLGKLISSHPAAKKFEDTLRKLQADVEAQRLMNDYNRALAKVGEKEQRGQPIEVEDKRVLEKAQTAIARHPTLRDLQMVQMDYLDLMRRVDEAMSGEAMPAEGAPGPAAPTSPILSAGAPPKPA